MSAPIEPLLLYQASQDEKCCHWVDSVYNRMNLREKVGQLFIYTIAPVQTKRNMQLLRDAVHTYKVGGLLFSGGKIQNQATLTNEAQRMARCPLLITFDGEWGAFHAFAWYSCLSEKHGIRMYPGQPFDL